MSEAACRAPSSVVSLAGEDRGRESVRLDNRGSGPSVGGSGHGIETPKEDEGIKIGESRKAREAFKTDESLQDSETRGTSAAARYRKGSQGDSRGFEKVVGREPQFQRRDDVRGICRRRQISWLQPEWSHLLRDRRMGAALEVPRPRDDAAFGERRG